MYANISTLLGRTSMLLGVLVLVAGCPVVAPVPGGGGGGSTQYQRGLDDGFLQDDWYWSGFWDSFDTKDYEPLYYQGSTIPELSDDSYDAGYYDGTWYAYNDGYFTDYRYAFIIGFSEGYDAAFYADYPAFLSSDVHIENLNGGWGDGYNDGFSEGRIFGAADYEGGLPFDWLDALLDYESGTDLYFEEFGVGTGEFGPVYLYEYGVDPITLKAARLNRKSVSGRQIRGGEKGIDNTELFRPLIAEARAELDVRVVAVPRAGIDTRYTNTRLDRLNLYTTGAVSAAKSARAEGVSRAHRKVATP